MRRLYFPGIIVLACFNCSRCVKYVHPSLPVAQSLLMAKPWILIYSEWVTFDSFNSPIYHVLPARDCEKQEVITFAGNPDYYVKLACSQAIPSVLVGDWVFIPDSTMGFGSKTTDTSIATA